MTPLGPYGMQLLAQMLQQGGGAPKDQAPAPAPPAGPPDLASLARARGIGGVEQTGAPVDIQQAGPGPLKPGQRLPVGYQHPKFPEYVWGGPGQGWVKKTDVGTAR